jgi:hypothetical protein
MLNKIVSQFPTIPAEDLYELLNIISQSNEFVNHLNDERPTNDFELAFAKYLGTPNQSFLDMYYNVVLEGCFREFLEWYEYIVKNILRKDVQDVLEYTLKPTDTDWMNQVKKSEVFGWALHVNDTQVFMENIDKVSKLGSIMQNFFNARKPMSTMDDDYFESDHAQLVLDSIDRILINRDMDELESHISSDKLMCMIEVYGWENKFNPVLISWICDNRERVASWT